MGIQKTALMIFGAVLIVAIAKGTIELLIPIIALMIPITAILAFSPIGRSIADSIRGSSIGTGVPLNEFNTLKEKHEKLEKRFSEYEAEINKMREAIIFSDNKKISSSENHKIDLYKKADMEKTIKSLEQFIQNLFFAVV